MALFPISSTVILSFEAYSLPSLHNKEMPLYFSIFCVCLFSHQMLNSFFSNSEAGRKVHKMGFKPLEMSSTFRFTLCLKNKKKIKIKGEGRCAFAIFIHASKAVPTVTCRFPRQKPCDGTWWANVLQAVLCGMHWSFACAHECCFGLHEAVILYFLLGPA